MLKSAPQISRCQHNESLRVRREMGCAGSKVHPAKRATVADHAGIPLLAKLDDKLANALQASAIKLLDADVLRSEGSEARLPRMLRRQELEAMERARGSRIFLSADEAVAALRAKNRSIAGLTYGWTTPDDPDVTAAYLAAMRRFLRSPLGAHVTAIFWE